ncbi:MAG TPA: hypothetical protein VEF90_08380, partial [Xanthobacteraceae bacterium]|nr:hypothetical protein [Xanthobacteraceae bacterium]
MNARPRRFAAMRGRLWRWAKLWRAERIVKGLAMMRKTMGIAFSAILLAGAFALSATGAANAESVMKQCGDEWKAAKAAGTTGGQTWQEF